MKISKSILKETGHIGLGVLVGDLIMLLVFFFLKKLDSTVWLGALLGSVAAVGNFFWMGLSVQKALKQPEKAKAMVQRSYTVRMLCLVAVLIVGFRAPYFHTIAVVVPILMPKLTIYAMQVLGLYRPEEKEGDTE